MRLLPNIQGKRPRFAAIPIVTRYTSAKKPGLTIVCATPGVIENSRSTSQCWRVMSEGCEGLASHWVKSDNVFEPGFLRCDRESDRALNHVRIERRTIIGALDVLQRVGNSLDIAHIGDGDLGPVRLQLRSCGHLPGAP